MLRMFSALGGAVLAMVLMAGVATATEPVVPDADQLAGSIKDLVAQSVTLPVQPRNVAGDAGASNVNGTSQWNGQQQAAVGGNAKSGDATAGQGHAKDKVAKHDAKSGKDHKVKPNKHAKATRSGDAFGGNVDQSQAAGNFNATHQAASATSQAIQFAPTNIFISIRVNSPGDDNVTQTISNTAGDAAASNVNGTSQENTQLQQGVGGDATSGAAQGGDGSDARSGDADGGDVHQSQTADNANITKQAADASSIAAQASSANVAVFSPKHHHGGDAASDLTFEQSADNAAGDALAGNVNGTAQKNGQGQMAAGGDATSGDATGGTGSDARSGDADGGNVYQDQSASNFNATDQSAAAQSLAAQLVSTRLHGGRFGLDGSQTATNTSGDAAAGNVNGTSQENLQVQAALGGAATSGAATGGDAGDDGWWWFHRGGDARSGDAYGGSVGQAQWAGNANVTRQAAYADSVALQAVLTKVDFRSFCMSHLHTAA
jgi:hypothetical protein